MTEPLLLAAARGKKTARPPVWLMRQAGRYLPEYRAMRQKMGTLQMFKTPEVACDITLQPLARFPMDGAIVYADILHIPDALGLGLSFREGEGPVFSKTVRTQDDVAKLWDLWNADRQAVLAGLRHVGETLQRVKARIPQDKTLIGFAGAPWTVACYMIEGRGTHGEFFEARRLAYTAPKVVSSLVDLVAEITVEYLVMQVNSGAQMLQLFESWGLALTPRSFDTFAAAPVSRILAAVSARVSDDVPVVYFVNGIAGLLHRAAALGSSVLGVDWRVDLAEAAQSLGGVSGAYGVRALQGNLDPLTLFAPEPVVRDHVRRIIDGMRNQPFGHIFNLGHGLRPEIPPEAVGWVVDEVLSTQR